MQDIAFAQYSEEKPTFTQTGSNNLIVGSAVTSDGSVHVTITSTPIEADQPLALQIKFTDPQGNLIPNENYGIRAQEINGNGDLLISNETAFAANGQDIQVTSPLLNVSPVNFQIQLYGSGTQDTSITEWTGPREILSITIGSQFGAPTAISEAPRGTSQVVTIPYGAYDPNFSTVAPQWYQPSTVTIGVNQNVTWINQDKEVHTVTSGQAAGRAGLIGNKFGKPDGLFDSGTIPIGGSWTHKFTSPGTFEYFCTIHPWMLGYVIVQQAQAEPVDAFGKPITKFPLVRFTPDRAYEVDLDWEPHYITTGQQITFVYQVYDNIKNEAIPAHYEFTITQGGQQLYHVVDSTQFGGAYQYFRFDNAGPVIFEFSDIAHTGQSVRYTTMVEQGNSTSASDMNMPMVEPARNPDLNWWLEPLFLMPAIIGTIVIISWALKRKKQKTMKNVQTFKKKESGPSSKRSPI